MMSLSMPKQTSSKQCSHSVTIHTMCAPLLHSISSFPSGINSFSLPLTSNLLGSIFDPDPGKDGIPVHDTSGNLNNTDFCFFVFVCLFILICIIFFSFLFCFVSFHFLPFSSSRLSNSPSLSFDFDSVAFSTL